MRAPYRCGVCLKEKKGHVCEGFRRKRLREPNNSASENDVEKKKKKSASEVYRDIIEVTIREYKLSFSAMKNNRGLFCIIQINPRTKNSREVLRNPADGRFYFVDDDHSWNVIDDADAFTALYDLGVLINCSWVPVANRTCRYISYGTFYTACVYDSDRSEAIKNMFVYNPASFSIFVYSFIQ
jgi:hypothetical protein